MKTRSGNGIEVLRSVSIWKIIKHCASFEFKKESSFPAKVLTAFPFDVFAPAKQGQDETSYSPFTRLRRQQRRSNSGKRKDRRVPGKPKTDIVVSVILIVPVAIRDPAVVGIVVPGPATNHPDACAGSPHAHKYSEMYYFPNEY